MKQIKASIHPHSDRFVLLVPNHIRNQEVDHVTAFSSPSTMRIVHLPPEAVVEIHHQALKLHFVQVPQARVLGAVGHQAGGPAAESRLLGFSHREVQRLAPRGRRTEERDDVGVEGVVDYLVAALHENIGCGGL